MRFFACRASVHMQFSCHSLQDWYQMRTSLDSELGLVPLQQSKVLRPRGLLRADIFLFARAVFYQGHVWPAATGTAYRATRGRDAGSFARRLGGCASSRAQSQQRRGHRRRGQEAWLVDGLAALDRLGGGGAPLPMMQTPRRRRVPLLAAPQRAAAPTAKRRRTLTPSERGWRSWAVRLVTSRR